MALTVGGEVGEEQQGQDPVSHWLRASSPHTHPPQRTCPRKLNDGGGWEEHVVPADKAAAVEEQVGGDCEARFPCVAAKAKQRRRQAGCCGTQVHNQAFHARHSMQVPG